jgi:hypothetical protein
MAFTIEDIENDDKFKSLNPEQQEMVRSSHNRSFGDVVGDVGVSALKGAVGLGASAVGLADLVTPGVDVGGALNKYTGYDPEGTKGQLDKLYSPAQQQAFGNVREAKGFGNTAKALLQNPSTIGHAVVEAAPYLIGGAGVSGLAAKTAPKLGAIGSKVPGIVSEALKGSVVAAGKTASDIRQATGTLTPTQSAQAVGQGLKKGVTDLATGRIGGAAKINLPGRLTIGASARQGMRGGETTTKKRKAIEEDLTLS